MTIKSVESTISSSVSLIKNAIRLPEEYSFLEGIPFIHKINQPTMQFSKTKKKFLEVSKNPISNICIDTDKWSCYPTTWNDKLTYIYIHEDNLAQGLAYCNLFNRACSEEILRQPDVIYMFGMKDYNCNLPTTFHSDTKNNLTILF